MSCRECHGAGTLFVLPGYVDQHQPNVPDDHEDVIAVRAKRAALANTVYPCPECAADRVPCVVRWRVRGRAARDPCSRPRAAVPVKARGGRSTGEPLPMEPTWLGPDDWSLSRKDLA